MKDKDFRGNKMKTNKENDKKIELFMSLIDEGIIEYMDKRKRWDELNHVGEVLGSIDNGHHISGAIDELNDSVKFDLLEGVQMTARRLKTLLGLREYCTTEQMINEIKLLF